MLQQLGVSFLYVTVSQMGVCELRLNNVRNEWILLRRKRILFLSGSQFYFLTITARKIILLYKMFKLSIRRLQFQLCFLLVKVQIFKKPLKVKLCSQSVLQ